MAVELKYSPKRTAPQGSACYWVASDNSIDFMFQRKDWVINSVQNGGTNASRINVSAGYNFNTQVGTDVYIWDITGRYTGTWQILSGGANHFYIGVAFTGNTIGFVNGVDLWPNYFLDLEVYNYRTDAIIGHLNFTPSSDGEIRCDLSTLLRTELEMNTRYKFEMVNKREETWDLSFGFRYSEVKLWDGSNFIATTAVEEGNQWYVCKAAKQLGDEFGQNMRNYEIYPEATTRRALFLDEGVIPTYFKGYPFSLSFLWGEQTTGVKFQRVVEELDVNQTLISGTNQTDYMAEVDQGHVNRLSLRKTGFDYGFTGMNADTHYLRMWIEETDEVVDDDLGGGGSSGGGGTSSGIGGGDASLLDDNAVGS